MPYTPPRPILLSFFDFFFFNDTATTEIYTLSLHDALPIFPARVSHHRALGSPFPSRGQEPTGESVRRWRHGRFHLSVRSEEHTSELQSHSDLVCRLLLEKKKRMLLPLV